MIIKLTDISENNKHLTGVKSYNLSISARNNLKISKGFVITTEIFDKYQKEKKLNFEEILKVFNDTFDSEDKIIVRSSANFEDNENHSFAGIFESYLNTNISNLEENIIKIYDSVYSKKALNYYLKNNIEKDKVKMSVIIQKQIEPIISGVCFTKNPINRENEYIIEYVEGSNAEFISGKASPVTLKFPKKVPISIALNDLQNIIQSKLEQFSLLESIFEKPQDIEWALDSNLDLFILQSRDIVFVGSYKEINLEEIKNKILARGVGISSGIATGKINILNTNLNFEELQNSININDIVVAHNLRVDQILAIKKASGVILSESSILSHVAIQAREFKIPCVGGIHNFRDFKNEQNITIDGASGLVFEGIVELSLLGNFENSNSQNFPDFYNFELIKEYKAENFTFLYCIKNNFGMIYLPDIDNKEFIARSTKILENEFRIPASNIFINQHRIYEKSSINNIYSNYLDFKKYIENSELHEILESAKFCLNNLDTTSFSQIINSERAKIHEKYIQGYTLFCKFKESKDTDILIQSAELLDKALQNTIFVNNILILILGTTYLEKLLERYQGPKLIDFLSKTEYPDSNLQKVRELAIQLENFKNTELEPLTKDGVSFINIIDYIYENGYEEFVIKYQW